MVALEGHISRALRCVAACERDTFRVALGVGRKRLAAAAEDRADACIAQAFELPPVIVDVGPEPGASVGDREQRLA